MSGSLGGAVPSGMSAPGSSGRLEKHSKRGLYVDDHHEDSESSYVIEGSSVESEHDDYSVTQAVGPQTDITAERVRALIRDESKRVSGTGVRILSTTS